MPPSGLRRWRFDSQPSLRAGASKVPKPGIGTPGARVSRRARAARACPEPSSLARRKQPLVPAGTGRCDGQQGVVAMNQPDHQRPLDTRLPDMLRGTGSMRRTPCDGPSCCRMRWASWRQRIPQLGGARYATQPTLALPHASCRCPRTRETAPQPGPHCHAAGKFKRYNPRQPKPQRDVRCTLRSTQRGFRRAGHCFAGNRRCTNGCSTFFSVPMA